MNAIEPVPEVKGVLHNRELYPQYNIIRPKKYPVALSIQSSCFTMKLCRNSHRLVWIEYLVKRSAAVPKDLTLMKIVGDYILPRAYYATECSDTSICADRFIPVLLVSRLARH